MPSHLADIARPSPAHAWLLALRPRTLSLSVAPVLVGCALAWAHTGQWRAGVALMTLLAALLIQIGTNLLNDVGDYERGADTAARLGPPRATAQGWLSAQAVRRAGLGALAGALALGVALAAVGGWPIVLLGLAALVCGWAYTSGPRPIAYGPWGEVLVWLFFGVAAVVGAYWLQAGQTDAAPWLAGSLLGALAAAVLLVNNTRDATDDAAHGRRTLAMLCGLRGARLLYAALLALPFALWPWLAKGGTPWAALALLALPWTVGLIRRFARLPPSAQHNTLLAHTARLQALWAVLLCVLCLPATA